ncbi:cobalamin B12-binding domain-containing protein [Methanomassiliicoccus luminyensis]|jgi:dimethylamine corrinoid protein|uniref:cobalamin B12-binding domain-containing protein n=1 Tax=Methanomassiliicoccus luminyensis TaxID=1080712 RepID=UPI0003755C50|nr:cobalamin-dependent protein [Methanomassiliicoccus luminyensis]
MSDDLAKKIMDVVIGGKIKEAKPLAEQALAAGMDPREIIFNYLSSAMATVGQKYETRQYFLPQVLMAAQTMYQVLDVVLPQLKVDTNAAQPGKVVLSVIEGDVHDIGKNIVKAMLTGAGLTIYDLGKDVPIKKIIEKAKAENAQIIATSTLMTPTLPGMKEIERQLAEENLKGKVKTIIGGGATSKEFADQIGTAWAPDAVESVKTISALLK